MASIARSTAARAVHLRISPRPSNLGESREILRLISQFGAVEYYKWLKYDILSAPNTDLVIFTDENAAYECLKSSPIRFRMGRAPAPPDPDPNRARGDTHHPPAAESPTPASPAASRRTSAGGGWAAPHTRPMSTAATHSLPDPPARAAELPFQPPPPRLLDSRMFQVLVNPARMHFRDHVDAGHYHGSFDLNTKSIAQQDLAQTVPLPGLSCVVNPRADGTKPWRVLQQEKSRERDGRTRRQTLRELHEEGPAGAATFRHEALPF